MKKFNLFKEIISVKLDKLQVAIKTQKKFGINIDGDICYEPYTNNHILIYSGKVNKDSSLEDALGKNYQVLIDDERVMIKAFSNWQELIAINTPQASYDDTTADGVDEFSDKDIEEIGWFCTEFDIGYRELVEILEKECEGTLLCIEQDEPYKFSGLGFLDNHEKARDKLYKYCQLKIKDKIANDKDYEIKSLIDDEIEAAKFFKVI